MENRVLKNENKAFDVWTIIWSTLFSLHSWIFKECLKIISQNKQNGHFSTILHISYLKYGFFFFSSELFMGWAIFGKM